MAQSTRKDLPHNPFVPNFEQQVSPLRQMILAATRDLEKIEQSISDLEIQGEAAAEKLEIVRLEKEFVRIFIQHMEALISLKEWLYWCENKDTQPYRLANKLFDELATTDSAKIKWIDQISDPVTRFNRSLYLNKVMTLGLKLTKMALDQDKAPEHIDAFIELNNGLNGTMGALVLFERLKFAGGPDADTLPELDPFYEQCKAKLFSSLDNFLLITDPFAANTAARIKATIEVLKVQENQLRLMCSLLPSLAGDDFEKSFQAIDDYIVRANQNYQPGLYGGVPEDTKALEKAANDLKALMAAAKRAAEQEEQHQQSAGSRDSRGGCNIQ